MLFDNLVNPYIDIEETMQEDEFIISYNGGRRRRDTTKGR